MWVEKTYMCGKDYMWNPARCNCEDGKYLACIIEDSVIRCDEIIDAKETKTITKNIICELKSFYISLSFLLIIIALLIAVRIYCYAIKI